MTGIYKKEAIYNQYLPLNEVKGFSKVLIKYIEYFRAVANTQGWAFGSKNNEARLTGDTMRVGGWGGEKRGNCDKFTLLHPK